MSHVAVRGGTYATRPGLVLFKAVGQTYRVSASKPDQFSAQYVFALNFEYRYCTLGGYESNLTSRGQHSGSTLTQPATERGCPHLLFAASPQRSFR